MVRAFMQDGLMTCNRRLAAEPAAASLSLSSGSEPAHKRKMSLWDRLSRKARDIFAGDAPPVTDVEVAGARPDPDDLDFTAAIVGLGAKLAKADGRVTFEEVEAFSRVFRATASDRASIERIFSIARQTVRGYEGYAWRLGRRYRSRPALLEGILDGLFQIAIADRVVTDDELAYLKTVAEAFGIPENDFYRIKASHIGPDPDDPYLVLGLQPDATFADVRAAYRRLMRENHPDTAVGLKSAPREYETVAHEKAAAITSAYARIRAREGFSQQQD
jgi:DnaJ like chaperone protein